MVVQFSFPTSILPFGRILRKQGGGNQPGDIHWRPVEGGRSQGPHQCLGVTSGNTSHKGTPATSAPGTKTCSFTNRQHNSCGLHKQEGGGHAPLFLQELWTMALDPGVSLTAQHIPGIQNTVAETASTQIETGKEEGFIYQNGSLCIPRKLSSAPVHYEIPGPRSTSCGRLSPGMKQVDLSNPSSGRPSPSDLEKDQSRPDNCSLNSSELGQTFIVPGASPDASGSTSADFPAPITVLSLTFQPAAQHPLWRSLHLALWPLSGSITKQQAFK